MLAILYEAAGLQPEAAPRLNITPCKQRPLFPQLLKYRGSFVTGNQVTCLQLEKAPCILGRIWRSTQLT